MKTTMIDDAKAIVSSAKFRLQARDFVRGLFMAIGGTILPAIYAITMQPGATLSNIDWGAMGMIGFNTGLNYLILNFFSKSKVMIFDPPKQMVATVKEANKTETPVKIEVAVPPDADDTVNTSRGDFNINPKKQ